MIGQGRSRAPEGSYCILAAIDTPDEIVRRGQELYERDIRAPVEQDPGNRGKILALDIESAEYELADDSLTALDRLRARRPGARAYTLRVGYPTAVKTGAQLVSGPVG